MCAISKKPLKYVKNYKNQILKCIDISAEKHLLLTDIKFEFIFKSYKLSYL